MGMREMSGMTNKGQVNRIFMFTLFSSISYFKVKIPTYTLHTNNVAKQTMNLKTWFLRGTCCK